MANQLTVKHYPGSPRWPSNVEEEVGGAGSSVALKTEEGATSQGKWVALEAGTAGAPGRKAALPTPCS